MHCLVLLGRNETDVLVLKSTKIKTLHIYFLVQVRYSLVLQKASLTCQRQWGRCTNFSSQLRSIMKASINVCNCSQVLGQCLKLFLNCFGCVSFLQKQAGD